jgi:hypothetical protein
MAWKKNREQREREGQACVEIGMCNNWPEQHQVEGKKGLRKETKNVQGIKIKKYKKKDYQTIC